MEQAPLSLIEPRAVAPIWKLDRSEPAAEPKLQLDADQVQVVSHRVGPLLVLAGPGTGKTATLTEAVIARLSGGQSLEPSEVLVLTFGRKAAQEIRERIVRRLGGGVVPTVCTFHSLALGLLRDYDSERAQKLRLLTGAEQDLQLRELLQAYVEGKLPESLAPAAKTRGLAVEIRNAVARAQSLGLTPKQLAAVTKQSPEWQLVGDLFGEYLQVAIQSGTIDYNELIRSAVELTSHTAVQPLLHQRYKAVFVDEYQDTDPLQVRLLTQLVGPKSSLIAVGDPDQSIYGFRGANAEAISEFANDFAYMGEPKYVALRHTRRYGEQLQAAAAAVIARDTSFHPNSAAAKLQHRQLITDPAARTELYLTEYESAETEAAAVAEQIRRVVLTSNGQLKWSDVAILVRSGVRSIPTLERALLQAGVPTVTSFDDLPLAQEPAVATLLLALETAVNPRKLSPAQARTLLSSPLAGLNPADLRRVSRAIRDANVGDEDFSEMLLARSLVDNRITANVDSMRAGDAFGRLLALQSLLNNVRSHAEKGATVHELLWQIWSGTEWPERLREQALRADLTAAAANHDIDAAITLFDLAASQPQSSGSAAGRVANFVIDVRSLLVSAQPLEPVLEPNAVALMTAHRAKGLQWHVVFICSADEGTWPDIRRRKSILEPDRLVSQAGKRGNIVELLDLPERSELVNEECRLFFVAMTRAKSFLYISSTTADKDAGRLPSRFLKHIEPWLLQLPDESESSQLHQPQHSVHALVAQLRRIGTDPNTSESMRLQVAARLQRLAALQDTAGNQLVPAADPRSWWGMLELSDNPQQIYPASDALYIRGSSLQDLRDCSLKWFLKTRLGADELAGHAAVFGNVVHAIAGGILDRQIDRNDTAAISEKIESVWNKVRFESPWIKNSEFKAAVECVKKFVLWLDKQDAAGAPEYFTEVEFAEELDFTMPDGTVEKFFFSGSIDIVEIFDGNQAYVADIKTGSTKPKVKDTKENPQLWMYQYALSRGIGKFNNEKRELRPTGAELIQVRIKPKTKAEIADGVVRMTQPALPEPGTDGHPFEAELARDILILRNEDFYPTTTDCSYCKFMPICPLKPEGGQVL